MSDSVFTTELRTVEYYRELKRLERTTDRELSKVERRIEQMERRSDRGLARRLTATQKQVQAELNRIAQDGARANAELNARLDREMELARQREFDRTIAHHRRMENRTRIYAMRMERHEHSHQGRLADARRLGGALMPGMGRYAAAAGAARGLAAPLAVAGAAAGVGLFGVQVARSAGRQDAETRRIAGQMAKHMRESVGIMEEVGADSIWWVRGLARIGERAAAGAKAARTGVRDARRAVVNEVAGGALGAGRENMRAIDRERDRARELDAEHARRMQQALAARSIIEAFEPVDADTAARRQIEQAIEAQGLTGTRDADRVWKAYEARLAEQARETRRQEAMAAAERRAQRGIMRAGSMAERAAVTTTFDDDRAAATAMRLAELEEARVRVMNDETIPAQERYNVLMEETEAINARQVSRLKAIDDAEAARAERIAEETRRIEEKNKALQRSVQTFEEQLAIEEASALGQKKRAEQLRIEADYRRRLEEIQRLEMTGERRAAAERQALAIRDAELSRRDEQTRIVGWSGLAGGETLRRQIQGASSPQQKLVSIGEKQVRVLEQIRDQKNVAVAG